MKFASRFNIEVLLEKIKNVQEAYFVNGTLNVPTHFLRGGVSDYINATDAFYNLVMGVLFIGLGVYFQYIY